MNYIQKFKDYLLALRPTPSKITVKNYSIDVKHFISWVEAQTQHAFNPQEITFSDIEKFRSDKQLQLCVRSLDRHVSSLRKFFQALKLQGIIAESPFELMKQQTQPVADPFYIKQFKDFLYVYNASNLTIKNYIIDVKQFLNWAQEVTKNEGIKAEDILSHIDEAFVKSYRDRLFEEKVFSPASINRKLSSLRKYLSWAGSQNFLKTKEAFQSNLNTIENLTSARPTLLPKSTLSEARLAIDEPSKAQKEGYSPFPPFRVAQKLGRVGLMLFDAVVTAPLAHVMTAGHKTVWSLTGKPLFKKDNIVSRLHTSIRVENISKSLFAPLTVSLKELPWHKKVIFHAKFTRPEWYKRYHSYAISHYFHWAILIIFTTAIGFGFYNNFVEKPKNSQPTLAATAPPRILSFQGRLTDSNNNPIVSATNLRFAIYNSISSTGSALLWEEVDRVQPDANGVFSVLLGNGTTIPQSLFANNSSLFLGIAVGQTPELTPRQQLATVAYATNAETLQGLPPITNSGNTTNVVLALDGSGNLTIGGTATPIFTASGGQFTLAGKTLTLTTVAGSNTNVQITPDGTGIVDVQKPLQNTTLNNNIASAKGAVEVDDLFAVLATSSGQSAVTINQNGAGPILSASSSGISRFTIGNNGAITDSNYTTVGGVVFTDGTGTFQQTTTSNNTQCLIGGTTPTWTSCSNIGQNFWQINNGALVPVNSTVDLFVGGTSTAAAKFAVLNVNPGAGLTTVASISAQNAGGQAIAIDSAGTIQTVSNAGLTIGGNTTGNITLSPLNGAGTVTVNGTGLQTNASVFNLFTATATTLGLGTAGGTTTVNSALTITGNITPNGQLAASLIPTSTSINLGSPTNNFGTLYAANVILPSTSGIGGYWQLNSGAVSPTNITNDVLAGGNSTASAKFAVLNMTGAGTPTASVSSGLNGNATFITADGSLQTARFQGLTVGGSTTGNITLNPRNGTGTVTLTGYSTGIIHSTGGLLSSSAINLAGGATEVTGILPLANGGTNANLTADNGGIVYSGAGGLAILAHASTVGQCLTSGGTSAPSWSSCSSAASNWWSMNAGALFPINNSLDLVLGSSDGSGSSASAKFSVLNMSGTGTPTASVSSGLNGTGMYFTAAGSLQTANNMGLTIGGATTGNITLAPLNSGTGSTVNVNAANIATNQPSINVFNTTASTVNFAGAATTLNVGGTGGTTTFSSATINDNQATVALLGSPTTINFGAGATTALNIGASNTPTFVNGNTTIGASATNTTLLNGLLSGAGVNNAVQPVGSLTTDLGSAIHYWGTVYAANFISPVSGGTSGFWQLTNNVISPVNVWNDLAIGNNATGSATPWQVFATTVGVNTAGTATSSGNLAFRGTATKINLLNGAVLDIQTSVGGDAGLASVLNIANNGNMTATGNLALNGGALTTTALTAGLFNTTATTVNIAGGATAATNIGHASGQIFLRGNVVLGTNPTNSITPNGQFVGSLIPKTTSSYDLGTNTLAWNNLYISGNYGGFWQRFNGVLSPYNITDDLMVGATASGSAFQVFGQASGGAPTGTASTSGQLTFRTSSQVNLLNNANLGFYNSVGGDSGITAANPVLYLASTGRVGINTNNPSSPLSINIDSGFTPDIAIGGGTNVSNYLGVSGSRAMFGYNNSFATIQGTSNHGLQFLTSTGTTFGTGTLGIFISGNGVGAVGVGTSAPGNAALAVNQQNISGLGDIFTASAAGTTLFTIANDGSIKNSLIPNITDKYDLGSDPSILGGREWNNLYVRQIITPASGGIAGFWQLNNSVLAPSNINNDLVVGGAATVSARFQVYATGTGAGSISATLNNPNILGNTNIMNIASANHTYATLNNLDFTLGGHKNYIQSGQVIRNTYIYDTSKDSDGGNWTNDERAQGSSWYKEALSSSTRGSTRPFPRKAIIVPVNGLNLIDIYDAKDNSLWMEFDKGATTTTNMVGPTTNNSIDNITAMNGRIYIASTGTAGGVYVIDFVNDTSYRYDGTGLALGNQSIVNRNTTDTYTYYFNSNAKLIGNATTTVAVNVVNGQTYLAAGEAFNTGANNGAVALINESSRSLVANYGPQNVTVLGTALTSTGTLYSLESTAGTVSNFAIKVKYNAQNGSGNNQLFDEVYLNDGGKYGATTSDSNTLATLDSNLVAGPASTSATFQTGSTGQDFAVTEGTSFVDGKSDTIYAGAIGDKGSVMVINTKKGDPSNGSIKYYNNDYITEDLTGDIRGMWPLSSFAASASGTLIGNILDASVKGNVASESGRPTYVSGVRGLGLSFNGTNQYLSCNNAQCGGAANLDPGGKALSIGAWVKTTTATKQMIVAKFNQNVGGAYYLDVEASGKAVLGVNGVTVILNSVRTVNDGSWHHIVGTYDGTTARIYIDGQLDGTQVSAGTISTGATADFFIGADQVSNAITNFFNGSIDEPFVAASVYTNAEIAHMYQVGWKALQSHSVNTMRGVSIAADTQQQLYGGGSSDINALGASMVSGKIYVGNQAPSKGVSIIGMDNDTLEDIYNNAITTTDDTGHAMSVDQIRGLSVGQGYGNGMILSFGGNANGAWMESNDVSVKDFMANAYNPFGQTLNQTNINVDGMLRVTNQISTRLDNMAFGATSSASLDLFQVDNNGNVLSRPIYGNANAVQFQDPAGNNLVNIDSRDLGNSVLTINQPGAGDIFTASASGATEFKVSNGGVITGSSFQDLQDGRYLLDPASTGNSLITAGEVTIGTPTPASASAMLGVIGPDTNGTDAFHVTDSLQSGYLFASYRSTGIAVPYAQIGAWSTSNNSFENLVIPGGKVGIGITAPVGRLDVRGSTISTGAFEQLITYGPSDGQTGELYRNYNGSATYLGMESFNVGNTVKEPFVFQEFGGNVGIGTNNPTTTLQVGAGGAVKASVYSTSNNFGQLQIGNPASNSEASIGFISGVTAFGNTPTSTNGTAYVWAIGPDTSGVGGNHFGFFNQSYGGNVMTVNANGSVGVATSTDTDGVTVNGLPGTGFGQFRMVNGSYGSFFRNDGSTTYWLHTGSGTPYGGWNGDRQIVLPNNSDNVYLSQAGGQVAVGTTPYSYFQATIRGGGNGGGQQLVLENTSSSTYYKVGPDASNGCFTIYPTAGTGLYFCPGNTGWSSNSDQRLKTDIQSMSQAGIAGVDPLSLIRNITPVTFHWKDTTSDQNLQLGFIAQQIKQQFPELVGESQSPITMHLADGTTQIINNALALDYQSLITPAIAAIQELDATMSAQQVQIATNSALLTNLNLTTTGNISIIANATPSADFTIPTYYSLNDALGNPIKQMGTFLELAVANLRAGSISTQQLFTNTLAIATDNVSIAGVSLRNYILGVVQTAMQNGTLSPIASVDQIHSNLISPLASNSAIAIDLTGSQFTIRNSATGSAVATIDNTGNATFSGTLNSRNLAVNSDATISGTLHAHKIVADDIEGLSAAVGTLSAQNITNVTNIYFATPSGMPTGRNYAMGQTTSSSSNSGLLTPSIGYTNLASYSSFLAYVPNLSASTALFDQGLTSLGPTALSDTTITGQLSIGTAFVLADNSINVLGQSLQIQPLRQGGVNFEGGLLAIDTDGNLTVNGNAVFSKTLAANIISPLANNRDLTFKLGDNPTASGAALASSNLSVQNASGSGIFTVDQLGNLVASGAANIVKLNFNLVQPALALSDTEVMATGSAGTATVKAHQTELTIDNGLVTDKSLIYITPVGQSGVTPYLIRQVNKTSFTTGISLPQSVDTTFNWLIVN